MNNTQILYLLASQVAKTDCHQVNIGGWEVHQPDYRGGIFLYKEYVFLGTIFQDGHLESRGLSSWNEVVEDTLLDFIQTILGAPKALRAKVSLRNRQIRDLRRSLRK